MNQPNFKNPTIRDYTQLLNQLGKVVQLIEIYRNAKITVLVKRYEKKRLELNQQLETMRNTMLFASASNARA
ncbi:hypothetical protein [Sutcliffiella rhizosphaerae]|uniref:Uncharacterized protein n=1 Tax=Sutcliffiella rhizosphaerae TaxID=2880967 RepID=A0ABN8A6W7_9BACI|nr:hypothetical protein [Sutcliffiella rhizosphaerae]CAG9620844.1 hypothetical protein BACCIP111883_01615 [Sutcliffiella rhizosphaerae]